MAAEYILCFVSDTFYSSKMIYMYSFVIIMK